MKTILGTLLFISSLFVQGLAADKPNVIIIFIDDMGYGDVGFNGATGPKTPELDRMGKEGMIFDDFYVGCAVCSGSRTALMTGTHYQRLSMNAVLFPQSSNGLHPDEMTIVIQHKFWGLEVREDDFEITLSFGGQGQRLFIPFQALTSFLDPSVQFGLQFGKSDEKLLDAGDPDGDGAKAPSPAGSESTSATETETGGESAVESRPWAPEEDTDDTNDTNDTDETDETDETKPSDNIITLDQFRKD